MNSNIKAGIIEMSFCTFINTKGSKIVNIIIIISIFSALLLKMFWFLFIKIEIKYCIKFIIFELIILKLLISINPVKAEKETVNSSGTEVAIPAIFPVVLELSFSCFDNFRKTVTNKYLDITTISVEK